MDVEYRVRPVTRYVVTRWANGENSDSSTQCGEYDNEAAAYDVGYALARAEHERLGYPSGDERVKYPDPLTQC